MRSVPSRRKDGSDSESTAEEAKSAADGGEADESYKAQARSAPRMVNVEKRLFRFVARECGSGSEQGELSLTLHRHHLYEVEARLGKKGCASALHLEPHEDWHVSGIGVFVFEGTFCF